MQATIQRLQNRLEHVREIKEEMGLHGPKIEELAVRKLRLKEPDLAGEWDDMRTAQRNHEATERQKIQQPARSQSLSRTRSLNVVRVMKSSIRFSIRNEKRAPPPYKTLRIVPSMFMLCLHQNVKRPARISLRPTL